MSDYFSISTFILGCLFFIMLVYSFVKPIKKMKLLSKFKNKSDYKVFFNKSLMWLLALFCTIQLLLLSWSVTMFVLYLNQKNGLLRQLCSWSSLSIILSGLFINRFFIKSKQKEFVIAKSKDNIIFSDNIIILTEQIKSKEISNDKKHILVLYNTEYGEQKRLYLKANALYKEVFDLN